MIPTFILTAMPSRKRNVEYLERHIPDLVVVWDEGRGAMDTFRRAWRLHQCVPTVRIQDDIILTVDFVTKALAAIEAHPDCPIQFFSRSKDDLTAGSRYKSGGSWMMNQCYYLPAGFPVRLTAFAGSWTGYDKHPNGDDQLMAEWMRLEKLRYWVCVPNLVDHLVTVSTIDPRRSKFRQSKTFRQPEKRFSPVDDA